jgi:DNA-binding CsgD family transcriptional regulator/tetratricopeptide (TPR) repeat protein
MPLVARLGSGIPLVARLDELGRLRAALELAEAGEATTVLLAGDAGVGKTRLLSELGALARGRDALVLTGRCLDLSEGGVPYLPFAEAFAPLPAMADAMITEAVNARPALGRLLPQHAAAVPASGAEHAPVSSSGRESLSRVRLEQDLGQLQLFDAVLGLLTAVAQRRPVVLLVEDLHWADESTRNLLSFLLSRLRSGRILVVGSYREEDVHRRHPLRALLSELVRLPAVTRLDLAPLAPTDARALVQALAEDGLDPRVVDEIAERSQGYPFFAEELLASYAEHPADDNLPAELAEVLLARLEQLSPQTRRVLRIAAVAGGAVGHGVLADVSGLGELELDEALREAVQHHVLVIEEGCYQFRHALLREAVYGDLLPGERTRVHAAYAARIRHQPAGRGQDARLAYHSLQSMDLVTALAALLRAADEAERLGAPGAALRHIEQALEIWDAVPEADRPADTDELRLLQEASYFAGTSGEPERAIAFARSAVRALTPEVPPARAAKASRRLALALLAIDGTEDEAAAHIERAWQLVADLPASPTRAWVLATRAAIMRILGRTEEASASAQAAVADARACGHLGARADALATLAVLAERAGNTAESRERLALAIEKARAGGAVSTELRARHFLALSYDDAADFAQAIRLYQEVLTRAEETGLTWSSYGLEARSRLLALKYLTGDWSSFDTTASVRGVSGLVAARVAAPAAQLAVARGDVGEAERLLDGLRPHRRNEVQILMESGAGSAELAGWRGDHRGAIRAVTQALADLETFGTHLLGGVRLAALGVEASAAAAAGGRSRGEEQVVEEVVAEGEKLLETARVTVREGVPRAAELGPEGRAWLARAEAAGADLRGRAEPRLWAEAVAAFGYGAVYEQAVCRWHHASVLLRTGEVADSKLAAEELREAHELAGRLGAVPLRDAVRAVARRARVELPGVAARATVDPLTDRERAVLELVARGHTNRQVGEQLYISEKTVSVHLSRVMAKLGAGRRAEAVAIAYDRGLLVNPVQEA